MADDHFTLLGAADYVTGRDGLEILAGSQLGVLRVSAGVDLRVSDAWDDSAAVLVTKSEERCVVHRPTPFDVVGIKRRDDHGHVVGERRVIGLFTSEAYLSSPSTIPLLRRKVSEVLDRSGFSPRGHDGKELRAVLEGYPRDELFAASADQLFTTAMSVVQMQERRRVRLFARSDVHRRVWTALVYLPRDRYTTDVRRKVEQVLLRGFGGDQSEYTTSLTESSLARLYFVIQLARDAEPVDTDLRVLEEQLAEAVRSWGDGLVDALIDQCGDVQGRALYASYADAFPPGYSSVVSPRGAVADVVHAERVRTSEEVAAHAYVPLDGAPGAARLKVFVPGQQIHLADLLPMLSNLGIRVLDEDATEIRLATGAVWIHDLGVDLGASPVDLTEPSIEHNLQQAFVAVWRREAVDDGFNRLVLAAGLSWREVHVMRAYARYLRQLAFTFSQGYVEATLLEQASITRDLLALFRSRFDPGLDDLDRTVRCDDVKRRITSALDGVASLDQDRIVRSFVDAIEATLRTNWFQSGADGSVRPTIAFKIETGRLADAPLPRPAFEIFVNSPRVEGVHLRMGAVARGGIRWSERPEDFRTEILGLMKAQAVKNAVIVPAGAKGGFVVQNVIGDRQRMQDEVVACYRIFIRALLDLTDNLDGPVLVPPPNTVRHDDDDPYLVVAADKGTATFSDIANELSIERGFWLGDAFASGGSAGYDHKAMAITARGAWESVKRHLRRLGRAPDALVTAVGIGDMSGDVFGNGMLLSEHLHLVAAFDHRHIFIDPTSGAGEALEERRRLFALDRSSWDDYDRALISEGGGVWARSVKSIALSAAACTALGVDAPAGRSMTPTALITAILRAPVDVLWNGGIGTYVKASAETHADVGDRANDAVRVDGEQLRCRIVGEGGNLGLTQRARIEFALAGGLVNTDAIDNSAGVDTSDHEVNLKILLDRVVVDGDLTTKQRNGLLAAMTDEVADLVLNDNVAQNRALVNAVSLAPAMIDVHARYLTHLENVAKLDRELDALPDTDELLERKAAGAGLVVPELAVLLAHTKLNLVELFLAERGADDPAFAEQLTSYFPSAIATSYPERIAAHPLRAAIIATAVVNQMVNCNGITFAFRMAEETHATVSDIVRAHTAASKIFGTSALIEAVCAQNMTLADSVEVEMLLEIDRLLERATRWLLRNRRMPLDVADAHKSFAEGTARVASVLDSVLSATERVELERRVNGWVDAGSSPELAAQVARLEFLPAALDIVRLSEQVDGAVDDVTEVYFAIDDHLALGALRDRILSLPRDDRWDALARAALRDDLAGEHRALAALVVASHLDIVPSARLEAWTQDHPAAVARHLALTREASEGSVASVAAMSVVLRELRTLATVR